MIRSVVLVALMMGTVNSVNAQNLEFKNFKVRNDQNVWIYSVKPRERVGLLFIFLDIPRPAYAKLATQNNGFPSKQQAKLTTFEEYTLREKKVTTTMKDSLHQNRVITTTKDSLQRKRGKKRTEDPALRIAVKPKSEIWMKQRRINHGTLKLVFNFLGDSKQRITLEIVAPKNVTKNGEIVWSIVTSLRTRKGTAPGPIGVGDPTVRYVIAGGVSCCWGDSVADFMLRNNALVIENEKRRRPTFSTGIVLNFFNWNNKVATDLLLSFEFGVDSSRVIDGFVWGLTFRGLQFRSFRLPELFFGSSHRIVQTLRQDFKEKARKLVPDRFTDENVDDSTFDGLSIYTPGTDDPIFPGTPLKERTTWAFVCGIVVPIDVGNWLADWLRTRLGG